MLDIELSDLTPPTPPLEGTATTSGHRTDNQGIEKPPQDRSAPRYTSLVDFKWGFPEGIMHQKTLKPLISTPRFVTCVSNSNFRIQVFQGIRCESHLPTIRDQLHLSTWSLFSDIRAKDTYLTQHCSSIGLERVSAHH